MRWYAYDGLGCVLAEIDGDGNMMSARVYDVYGGVRRTAGTATSPPAGVRRDAQRAILARRLSALFG
jgi:hypothetical protein